MQRTDSFARPWCWERLKMGGEGDNRGWDGWMASPTQWTWVWVNSRSWWWTGRPGVLQSMELQRVVHDWVTKLTELSRLEEQREIMILQPQFGVIFTLCSLGAPWTWFLHGSWFFIILCHLKRQLAGFYTSKSMQTMKWYILWQDWKI